MESWPKRKKKKPLDSKYKNPPIYSVIASEETILLLLDLITPHLLHFPSYRKDSAFAETVMSSWTQFSIYVQRRWSLRAPATTLCRLIIVGNGSSKKINQRAQ